LASAGGTQRPTALLLSFPARKYAQAAETFERLSADGYAFLPDLVSSRRSATSIDTSRTIWPLTRIAPQLGKFKAPADAPKGTTSRTLIISMW